MNVIHLLTPSAMWVRYGSKFPTKITARNHVEGSALTVAPHIRTVQELDRQTVAVSFWSLIKAQLWTRQNQTDSASLLSNADEQRYSRHPLQTAGRH